MKNKSMLKKVFRSLLLLTIALNLCSCYVQHPRYSEIEKVTQLETGIDVDSVNSILNTVPHDMISLDSNGTLVLLYKYRVKEIRRLPLFMKKSKGIEVEGHWKDLIVTVSPEGKVIHYESRAEELISRAEKKKIDPNELIQSLTMAITVVLPALLVFFSSQ